MLFTKMTLQGLCNIIPIDKVVFGENATLQCPVASLYDWDLTLSPNIRYCWHCWIASSLSLFSRIVYIIKKSICLITLFHWQMRARHSGATTIDRDIFAGKIFCLKYFLHRLISVVSLCNQNWCISWNILGVFNVCLKSLLPKIFYHKDFQIYGTN